MNEFIKAIQGANIEASEPKVKEYRLMYYVGAWVTSSRLYAENDAEAVHDADELERIASDRLQYALYCGNRKVKEYPAPARPWCKIEAVTIVGQ